MAILTLYGTVGCHLCDEAEHMLQQVAAARGLEWRYVDIADSDVLVERYGERIPILQAESGQELSWPFSLLDVVRLL